MNILGETGRTQSLVIFSDGEDQGSHAASPTSSGGSVERRDPADRRDAELVNRLKRIMERLPPTGRRAFYGQHDDCVAFDEARRAVASVSPRVQSPTPSTTLAEIKVKSTVTRPVRAQQGYRATIEMNTPGSSRRQGQAPGAGSGPLGAGAMSAAAAIPRGCPVFHRPSVTSIGATVFDGEARRHRSSPSDYAIADCRVRWCPVGATALGPEPRTPYRHSGNKTLQAGGDQWRRRPNIRSAPIFLEDAGATSSIVWSRPSCRRWRGSGPCRRSPAIGRP